MLATAEPMETAASSPKERMTTCTPVRTETSTAKIRAAVGRSMTTVAGRIRAPSLPLMPRMRPGHKRSRPNSVLLKAPLTDLQLHNSRQSLQGQFNSLIEPLRHGKQERSGHDSTNNRAVPIGKGAKDVHGVLEAPRAVDLNERRLIMNDRRKQSSPGLRNGISRAITPFAFADDGRGIGQGHSDDGKN